MPQSIASESVHSVEAYFEQLGQAFATAAQRQVQIVQRSVAGHTLRFQIAGRKLERVLQNALEHLPITTEPESDLNLLAWDQSETGIPLPQAPWEWPSPNEAVKVALPASVTNFRISYHALGGVLVLYNCETRTAILWAKDITLLPTSWHGSPFINLFHWFFQDLGLYLLHAGCVGTKRGAVILAGKGGSGKSTTSLLCLEAGMKYISDDYCLLAPGDEPRAHCLYNTGKLHRDHIGQFPSLAKKAVDPRPDILDKKVIYTQQHYSAQIELSLPLRAVLLPKICPRETSQLVPITPAEALRGLAPSTLFQLPENAAQQFRTMSTLVRQLPCYRLKLGRIFSSIPATIKSVLK